ncbi:hypothetical protein DFH09DRAFT_1482471 [Mycena vulgaris]|nr:hypothetical protein DFH09DRAFT_1482471 [Mycena vulgaris]
MFASSFACAEPACPAQYSSGCQSGNGKEVRVIVQRVLSAVQSNPPRGSGSSQRGSGWSYVDAAGDRPLLFECSDARPMRGIITHDVRTPRSSWLPYPRTGARRRLTGWRLAWDAYGAGLEYHMADGLVNIGFAVDLDYKTLWVEPYHEFQGRGSVCPACVDFKGRETPPALPPAACPPRGVWSVSPPPATPFSGLRVNSPPPPVPAAVPMTTSPRPAYSPPSPHSTPPPRSPATSKHAMSSASSAASSFSSAEFDAPALDATIEPTSKAADSSAAPIALRACSTAFTGSPTHTRATGVGTMLRHDAPTAGAVGFGVSWEEDESHHDLARRARDAPGGDVCADRVPRARAAAEPGFDQQRSPHVDEPRQRQGDPLRLMRGVDGPALSGESGGAKVNAEGKKGGVDAGDGARRHAHIAMNVGAYVGLAWPAWVCDYVADDGGEFSRGMRG